MRVASLRSSAASGLASLPDGDGGVLLALANYYGDSSLFAFDPGHLPRRAGKRPTAREVQRVSTSAAHDWEALRLPDGTEQLVVANSEATYSVVLQRNDTRLRHALPRRLAADQRPAHGVVHRHLAHVCSDEAGRDAGNTNAMWAERLGE